MDEIQKKPKDRFMQRNKKRDEKAETVSQAPKEEEPIVFHAHALDIEPGVVIPPRPSVDLTYNDFTRESYQAGEKPFVPKKKKIVPFELSETPKTQSEYWEGRAPGRRKLLNAMEQAEASDDKAEPRRHRDRKNREGQGEAAENAADKAGTPGGKAPDKRDDQRRKPEKAGLMRKVFTKTPSAGSEGGPEADKAAESKDATLPAGEKRQEQGKAMRGPRQRDKAGAPGGARRQGQGAGQGGARPAERDGAPDQGKAPDQGGAQDRGGATRPAVQARPGQEADAEGQAKGGDAKKDNGAESAKESLMRPYWMKKKK